MAAAIRNKRAFDASVALHKFSNSFLLHCVFYILFHICLYVVSGKWDNHGKWNKYYTQTKFFPLASMKLGQRVTWRCQQYVKKSRDPVSSRPSYHSEVFPFKVWRVVTPPTSCTHQNCFLTVSPPFWSISVRSLSLFVCFDTCFRWGIFPLTL